MIDQELAQSLKAWPFKEALQIIKKNGGLQNFKIPSMLIYPLLSVYKAVKKFKIHAPGWIYMFFYVTIGTVF